ncbi:hatching enzyme 1.2-like [Menidia menidia]
MVLSFMMWFLVFCCVSAVAGVPVELKNGAASSASGNATTVDAVLQLNATGTKVGGSSSNTTHNETTTSPASKHPVLNESAETLADMHGHLGLDEGDILLAQDRNAVDSVWSGGVIPYVISPELAHRGSEIQAAFRMISGSTCIRFQPHAAEFNYLEIKDGNGCASFIGCRGGSQPVYFSESCSSGNLAHELLHALGLYHEHTRKDRDDYVTVNWPHISPSKKDNFKVKNGNTLNSPYDFGSILHYGPAYFSVDGGQTLEPKQSGVQIGQRKGLSQLDIQKLNILYNCGGSRKG